MKKFTVVLLMLLATVVAYPATYAVTQLEVDFSDPISVVAYLTTFIVLVATWLVKKIKPSMPGWLVLMIVTGLSALVTYLTNLLGTPDLSWMAQFGLGLAATFIHQLSVQFSGGGSK
ncbi:MAG TPA: hypothetical protein VLY84_00190 [Dysgonamonadaceae bacterium]|nr:hypothetical protein [Dysgonamonadaceae bacterium]